MRVGLGHTLAGQAAALPVEETVAEERVDQQKAAAPVAGVEAAAAVEGVGSPVAHPVRMEIADSYTRIILMLATTVKLRNYTTYMPQKP